MRKTDYCVWVYRPGTSNSHWAFTTCKPGFSPLTRIPDSEPFVGCADFYNDCLCPICDKPIKMDYRNIEEN